MDEHKRIKNTESALQQKEQLVQDHEVGTNLMPLGTKRRPVDWIDSGEQGTWEGNGESKQAMGHARP